MLARCEHDCGGRLLRETRWLAVCDAADDVEEANADANAGAGADGRGRTDATVARLRKWPRWRSRLRMGECLGTRGDAGRCG